MKKKISILLIVVISFLVCKNVSAKEIIYNKQVLEDEPYVIGTASTPTNDGGYAATGYDLDGNIGRLLLIKYDSDGKKEWQRELEIDMPPFSDNCSADEILSTPMNGNSNDCHMSQESERIAFVSPGLVQMDDGKYMVFGPNGKGAVVSGAGVVENYFPIEMFNEGLGKIKCFADGNRAICSQVYIENEHSHVVSFNEDGSILNQYNFDDYDAGGSVISFFRDNEGRYIAEVLEGSISDLRQENVVNYLYIFDNNANFVAKTNENILKGNYISEAQTNHGGMLIEGYDILGQLNDGSYIGVYIKFMSDIGRLKLSYVRIDENLQKVEKERSAVNVVLLESELLELYIRYMANFYIMMFGGVDVGENVLLLELGYGLNSSYITITENLVTLDRDLNYLSYNKVGELELNAGRIEATPYAFVFPGIAAILQTNVIKLDEGNDVVFMPTDTNTIRGQHLKLRGRYTATGNEDSYFNSMSYAVGERVPIVFRQKDGYHVEDVVIVDSTGKQIEYRKDDGTFVMPDRNVFVKEVYYAPGEAANTSGGGGSSSGGSIFKNPKTATPISIIVCLLSMGAGLYGLHKYQKKM